ncbi:hypothetical protein [Alienimonas sp. DA493]|uniref:hypothetical protein n=1 Tax=Alienimonas sp. DA493 TaxID=3373605 RepID=UPI0037553804
MSFPARRRRPLSLAAVAATLAGVTLSGACVGCRSAGGSAVVDAPPPASVLPAAPAGGAETDVQFVGHWDDLPVLAPEAAPLPAAADEHWATRTRSGSVDSF